MSVNAMTRLMQIIQQAVNATDFNQQAEVIVDGISRELEVDVCSLYRLDEEQSLLLVSSHGLANAHPVIIPKGQGLVGQVVKTGQVINIVHPDQHPAYFYVPDSDEAQLQSFCGVPLIQHAQVVGVLVVQKKQEELLDGEEEALLLTLASHLAMVLQNLPTPRLQSKNLYKGVSGAAGIAVGHALYRYSESLSSVLPQQSEDVSKEKIAWESLRGETLADLQRERHLIEQGMGEGMAALMDAYQQFLLDPGFTSHLEACLDQGGTLPWAIKQTVGYFAEQFLAIDDAYLQARHEDIIHLGDKLYQIWHRSQPGQLQELESEGANADRSYILCGDLISVSDIISLPTAQLAGVVCGGGAALSHVAVFANALGIPAVMGVGELPFGSHDQLIVDGSRGEVLVNPSSALISEYRVLITAQREFDQSLEKLCHMPAITLDGQAVTLLANSGLQADIQPGLDHGADGIGLYRTELPFMAHASLPTEEEQLQIYRHVIEAYGDKPVCFRLLDIGGDKPLTYLPANKEENPALGLRGIRFLLANELILKTQLRAILRAAQGRGNTQILLPMLTTTQELTVLSDLLDAEVHRLVQEGLPITRPALGVMVEVPGVVSMLPFWKDSIDFVSIGSNDLSQYLLALDRNNPLVALQYDPLHPAVLVEIHRIITTANACELPVSLCGEMASDPISVLLLTGMGIRRFSMSAARIPSIKWLIQQVKTADLETLVTEALKLSDAESIRKLAETFLASLSTDAKILLGH